MRASSQHLAPFRRPLRGQSLIIFTLLLSTVFLGVCALAVDIANYAAQRRILQNAVDAAALAAAQQYRSTSSPLAAAQSAAQYLEEDYPQAQVCSPAEGSGAALICGVEVDTSTTDPSVRVAARAQFAGIFSPAIGRDTLGVSARARAALLPPDTVLPIAIKRFDRGRTDVPLNGDTRIDYLKPESQSGGQITSWPSPLNANHPTPPSSEDPGPSAPIIGPDVAPNDPTQSSSFNGWVMPDVRNLDSSPTYMHGVTGSSSVNPVKVQTAQYVSELGGYPLDPDNPPPAVNQSIAAFDGANVGLIVDAISARYQPGSEILGMVYDGTIYRRPDFKVTSPDRDKVIWRSPANSGPSAAYTVHVVSENNYNTAQLEFSVQGLSAAYAWSFESSAANTPYVTTLSGTNTSAQPRTVTLTVSRSTVPSAGELIRFYVIARDLTKNISRQYAMVLQAGPPQAGYAMFVDFPSTTVSSGDNKAQWPVTFVAYDGYNQKPTWTLGGGGSSGTVTIPGSGTKAIQVEAEGPWSTGTYTHVLESGPYTDTLTLQVSDTGNGNSASASSDFLYVLGYALFRIDASPGPGNSNSIWARAISPLAPTVDAFLTQRIVALVPWQ